jgi:DNA primase
METPEFWQAYDRAMARLDLPATLRALQVMPERRGRNYWFSCPFHGSRKAVFSVMADGDRKGFSRCWNPACDWRGSLLRFAREAGGLSSEEALQLLGIDLAPDALPLAEDIPFWRELETQIERLFMDEIHYDAPGEVPVAPWPTSCLPHPAVTDYLHKRGFADPDGAARRYRMQLCIGGHYAGRLVFPCEDRDGVDRFFGARTIGAQVPKILYPSGPRPGYVDRYLLGEGWIEAGREIVLVEGPFDCFKLREWGVPAVASFHARLSVYQRQTLIDLAPAKVCIAYDGDDAGRVAAWEAWIALSAFVETVVVQLPDDRDPGDMKSYAEWEALPEGAPPDAWGKLKKQSQKRGILASGYVF